jgi:hypothetical protein
MRFVLSGTRGRPSIANLVLVVLVVTSCGHNNASQRADGTTSDIVPTTAAIPAGATTVESMPPAPISDRTNPTICRDFVGTTHQYRGAMLAQFGTTVDANYVPEPDLVKACRRAASASTRKTWATLQRRATVRRRTAAARAAAKAAAARTARAVGRAARAAANRATYPTLARDLFIAVCVRGQGGFGGTVTGCACVFRKVSGVMPYAKYSALLQSIANGEVSQKQLLARFQTIITSCAGF